MHVIFVYVYRYIYKYKYIIFVYGKTYFFKEQNFFSRLSSVSLDIADERNTYQARTSEVEECSCPVGYRGHSCEDCDAGYTRTDTGLYLGICEPCSCNGHSSQCDPDTGRCFVSYAFWVAINY